MKRILVFASGNGSNAERIIEYFTHQPVNVSAIVCNNAKAGVIQRAWRLKTPLILMRNSDLSSSESIRTLQSFQPDVIVLAGWLAKIPEQFIDEIGCPILNIHPALLPNYGGKGMYGMHVHNAVIQNKEETSGITIHYVNSEYDEGNIIHQASVNIEANETAETLAQKVHALEYEYYPKTIEQLLAKEEQGNGKY